VGQAIVKVSVAGGEVLPGEARNQARSIVHVVRDEDALKDPLYQL